MRAWGRGATGASVRLGGPSTWVAAISCIGIQTVFWLAGAEGNDAPDWIVRRHADGHAITGDYFDTEAPHPAAQLSEHFVAGIALDAIQTSRVHRYYSSLHID